MAELSKGYTFGATELVTNVKLHTLIDSGSISNIVNADINANASIVDTKLAQITTTGKVNVTSFAATSQVRGDILYFNGTNWARLAKGSVSQVLYMGADDPYWG